MPAFQRSRERLQKALSILRLQAFDETTEAGRSHERYRRAALSTLAAMAARGIQILTSLVTVPLTLHYLGLERYGMWMTISSTIAMISCADLGIGNGLLNAISEAKGRNDRDAASTYVSSAFFALIAMGVLVGIAFSSAYSYVPWSRLFNVTSLQAISEVGPAVAVFIGCFLVSMPLGVVQRVRMGYQEGFIDSIWLSAASLAALAAVFAAVYLQVGLPWLVAAVSGVPVLVQLVNGYALFGWNYRWLRPRFSHIQREATLRVVRTGGFFFILQVTTAVAFYSDSLILAQILGAESVSRYAVPMKLFQFAPMLVSYAYSALWPAYGESMARGDVNWIRITLLRSLKSGLAVVVPVLMLLVLFGKPIIRVWAGSAVVPSYLVLVAMAIWAAIGVISGSVYSFLNGIGILRFQAINSILMMIANVGLSIWFTHLIGLSGVVWGSILSQIIFILIPTWVYIRYLFRRGFPMVVSK